MATPTGTSRYWARGPGLAEPHRAFEFGSLAALAASPEYATFTWMAVGDPGLATLTNGRGEEVPVFPALPPALEVLCVDGMRVRALPPLPATMRELHVRMTLLAALPACATCPQLEEIAITHSYIEEVAQADLPHSLRTLDLSWNVLRRVPPPDTLRHVHTSFEGNVHIALDPPRQRVRPLRHATFVNAEREAEPSVYTNAQNVHATSVQRSATAALAVILAHRPEVPPLPPHVLAREVTAACFPRPPGPPWWLWAAWWLHPAAPDVPPLAAWVRDPTLHSRMGVTFGTLLDRVWLIAKTHAARQEICAVLRQELLDGRRVCTTGRFVRVINALSGFVDGVTVGVSDAEQLQHRVVAAMNEARKATHEEEGDAFAAKARELVRAVLQEMDVPAAEWDAWLNAI